MRTFYGGIIFFLFCCSLLYFDQFKVDRKRCYECASFHGSMHTDLSIVSSQNGTTT